MPELAATWQSLSLLEVTFVLFPAGNLRRCLGGRVIVGFETMFGEIQLLFARRASASSAPLRSVLPLWFRLVRVGVRAEIQGI